MPVIDHRGQEGFTMIMTMIGLALISTLVLVAVTAVGSETHLSGYDLNQKKAYEAAKAGIDDYAYNLHTDNGYWSKCTNVPAPNAINQQGSTAKRRPVPGNSGAEYALELIPATTGPGTCDPTTIVTATASMLESLGEMKGTFRIRSTGFSGKAQSSITATFKPASFLDYVYFTQRETSDPVTYGFANPSAALTGAYSQCGKAIAEGRYLNTIPNDPQNRYCDTISFVDGDSINGPMHTNDAFVICGSPRLGRDEFDSVEVSGPPKGWFQTKDIKSSGSSCSGSDADFEGAFTASAPVITPPPTNSELNKIAGLKFTGQVKICLSGTSMTVGAGKTCNENIQYNGAIPTNGVVYVSSGECTNTYSPFTAVYPAPSGCGNAYIHGEYSGQLTLATENDIVVDGSLIHSGEGVLGLIANNFVRIYHPYSSDLVSTQVGHNECGSGGSNGPGSIKNLRIDAAILAINHSFIVDHYDCGSSLGTLTVNGAIAQMYRGAVGTTNGRGYLKSYTYDDRLRYIQPPSFIQPQQTDWVVGRETIE
jgi:type II secretory pathway pseudopilin PulG